MNSRNHAWPDQLRFLSQLAAAFAMLAAVVVMILVAPETFAQTTPVDYDIDADNLIEISYLEQLNAVRWDLDGDGAVDDASDPTAEGTDAALYAAAFPGMDCPDTCRGYELKASLDFDPDGDGHQDGDAYWNSGAGWLPIGDSTDSFSGVFEGNGHTIKNLFINRDTTDFIGLFARLDTGGAIREVALVD